MKKIILMGRSECGKTTLTQALRGREITYHKTQYINNFDVIIDTPGEYLQTHAVDVVSLTIPQSVAQETANHLIELGVRGFWNFTNVELSSADPNVKFENIHFADSLLTLSYRIANR